MAQLDGGGSGSGDVGDTTNVADDTNIDGGGTEAVDPAGDVELDRRTERRLRRDAQSDPMAEQTEPAPSPTDTSATVDGGSEATTEQTESTSAPSPEGTSATVDSGDGGAGTTTPTDDSADTDQGAIDASQLEEPDGTAARADTGPTGPSPADTDRFTDELGGDPAGGSDQQPDTGPTPEDIEQTDDTAAPVGSDGPQPVSGAGPTQDDLQAPPEAADAGAAAQEQPPTTQGIEESGATAEVQAQAQEFEQQVLAENPWLNEEDVAVQLVGTEEGVRFSVELTEGAEGRVSQRQQRVIGGLGIGAGSLAATGGTDPAADAQADAEVKLQDALEGIGFFDEQAEQEQALREAVEEDIEGQVGAARTERAGISNPTLRENVVEGVDLEEGEDFTLDIREQPGGRITVDAELTEEFSRAEATRAFERRLRNRFGVELEAGDDFRVVEGEEGGFEVEFTEEGQGQVGLSTLDRTVRDIERGDIPILTDATGIRGLQFDVPGEGAVVPEARDTSILTIEEDTYTLADLGQDFSETVRQGLDVLESNITENEAELRRRDVEITGGYGTGEPNPLREAAFAGVGDFAGIIGQGAGLPTRGSRFLAAGIEAEQEGQLGEFGQTASVTGQRLPAEFASGQIGRFRDEPVAATGGLVGTLVGSALVMRAVPRSRFLIQPAEEAVGIGGFGLTRRIAGERTAQRLFPNREPLFLSEEFVIQSARRLGGGTRRVASRVERGAGDVTGRTRGGLAERVRQAPTVRLEADPEAGFVSLDPTVRANLRETARRPGQAIRGGLEAVRQTPSRVRTGAVEAGRDVLERGEQTLERGRQTLTRIGLEADDAAFRAGQRTAAGVERATELPGEIAESPGAFARGVGQRGASAIETGRQRLTLGELQAEQLGFRAGARTAEGVNRFEDALGTVAEVPGRVRTGAGRVRAAPREAVAGFEVGRGAAGMSDLPGFEAFPGQIQTGRAFEAGFEVGETAAELPGMARETLARPRNRVIDTGETLVELPGRTREGAADLLSTGRQRWTLAELQAEELGYRAGARTAEGVNRLVELDPADAISGRVTGAVETGRQRITALELRAEDFGFRAGQRTAAGVERVEAFPSRVASLTDLTVRIEPGVPARPVVPDAAFEVGETEADAPETFAGPFETEDTGIDDSPLDPRETGRGEGPVLLGTEARLEAPTRIETETATEAVAPRLETTLGGDVLGETAPTLDVGAESFVATGEGIVGDVRGGQMERVRLGLEEELGLDLEQEAGQELRLGTEFEAPFELELELEQEAEAEAEAEFETRGDLETEVRAEPLFDERPGRRDDELVAEFDEQRQLVERDLLNPLTGR